MPFNYFVAAILFNFTSEIIVKKQFHIPISDAGVPYGFKNGLYFLQLSANGCLDNDQLLGR